MAVLSLKLLCIVLSSLLQSEDLLMFCYYTHIFATVYYTLRTVDFKKGSLDGSVNFIRCLLCLLIVCEYSAYISAMVVTIHLICCILHVTLSYFHFVLYDFLCYIIV